MSELKPGRELDALIAEKVFEARLVYSAFADDIISCDFPDRELGHHFPRLPAYSTSIEAAWKVVEKVIELPQFNDRHCYFNIKQHRTEFKEAEVEMRLFELRDGEELLCGPYYVLGESAPHAICLAALKAVGYDPNK